MWKKMGALEKIQDKNRFFGGEAQTHRLRVPGGWLVRVTLLGTNNVHQGPSVALVFVPDTSADVHGVCCWGDETNEKDCEKDSL